MAHGDQVSTLMRGRDARWCMQVAALPSYSPYASPSRISC